MGSSLDDLHVGLGRPAEARRGPRRGRPRGPAAGEDVPRHDQTVAAVVPDSAENDVPPPGDAQLPGEDLERRLPGVFHEDLLRYPQVFAGLTVHLPHLFDAADLHRSSPVFIQFQRASRRPRPGTVESCPIIFQKPALPAEKPARLGGNRIGGNPEFLVDDLVRGAGAETVDPHDGPLQPHVMLPA